jgi:hypothetical protein
MKDAVTSKPAILIDLKKYRIRIHKNTLYLLGNPEYIMFLVNPSDRIIAIRCGTKSDRYAHRINWESITNRKSYELYSSIFVQALKKICAEWQGTRSYRIYGEIIPNVGIAQFRMSDSIAIDESQVMD